MTAGQHLAVGVIRAYQIALSPVKGMFFGAAACCRYTPTCSCYAIDAFRIHGVAGGAFLTARRLLRCHPWGGAGYDPVPRLEDITSDPDGCATRH